MFSLEWLNYPEFPLNLWQQLQLCDLCNHLKMLLPIFSLWSEIHSMKRNLAMKLISRLFPWDCWSFGFSDQSVSNVTIFSKSAAVLASSNAFVWVQTWFKWSFKHCNSVVNILSKFCMFKWHSTFLLTLVPFFALTL